MYRGQVSPFRGLGGRASHLNTHPQINNESVVIAVFKAVGYTYGPILGLFVYGMFIRRKVKDRLVPVVAVISPILTYAIASFSTKLFNG